MKSVFRSCLDPLPRFLSMRGLLAVVLVVVAGTGLSVYEYVQSSRSTEVRWPRATLRASGGAPARSQPSPCVGLGATTACEDLRAAPANPTSTAEAGERPPSPAILYRPDAAGTGS
ncbi:MAG: hypothetical protein U1F29_07045 [Planctomycetota bacterium]